MKTINENVGILSPINQLNLYGYEDYFHLRRPKTFTRKHFPSVLACLGRKQYKNVTNSVDLTLFVKNLKPL